MEIYTYQISNADKITDRSIKLLDVTVKSGNRVFAPTWAMVLNYKSGTLSENNYTIEYLHMMTMSQIENRDAWRGILNNDRIGLGCYCKPGKFCHRHLLARILVDYADENDILASINGEIPD